MFEYIIGTITVIFLYSLIQLFGTCLTKKENNYSYNFVFGYTVYSFMIAIVGIPLQFLNLSWNIFFWYMILLIGGMIIFCIYSILNKKIVITVDTCVDFFKDNWFLILISIVLIVINVDSLNITWSNNLTDDGFYINRMATYPYVNKPFSTDPTSGIKNYAFNLYSLNTYELESSFFLYITKITATLYARCFLSIMNYYFILSSIKAFFVEMNEHLTHKISKQYLQFFVVIVYLLIVNSSELFLHTDEAWRFKSAAFYGSTIAIISTPFVILTPLINTKKINLKDTIVFLLSCVMLVSKSTVAVPIIFLVTTGYLISIFSKQNWYLILLYLCILLFAIIAPSNVKISEAMIDISKSNISNFLVLALMFSMVLLFRVKTLHTFLIGVLLAYGLIFVPEINDCFETFCNYIFVADRALISITLFILMIDCFGIISLFSNKSFLYKTFYVSICFICSLLYTTQLYDINQIKLYANNIRELVVNYYFAPNSTILLGNAINEYLETSNEELVVVMNSGIRVDGYDHFPASIIRSFSPKITSLTALLRIYSEFDDDMSEFDGYCLEEQSIIESFMNDYSPENFNKAKLVLNKYNINCLIGINVQEMQKSCLKELGFIEVMTTEENEYISYNIFVKTLNK